MSNELTNHALDTEMAPSATSLADHVAGSIESPQPAWQTLDIARQNGFTGEISFASTPPIVAYLDEGAVYYAERAGDASLCQRLLHAGVVTAQQLERGVVRVGDAEHLGRLFDRDATIDRDAVMVVVEAESERIVSELASGPATSASINAYRHHQSGVHRWFVAPSGASVSRPVSAVNQVDRSVVDELPGLSAPVPADVRIEWDEPGSGSIPDEPSAVSFGDVDIAAELDGFDADQTEWTTPVSPASPASASTTSGEGWLDDFQIVWPDGTEESATPPPPASPVITEPLTLDTSPPSAPIISADDDRVATPNSPSTPTPVAEAAPAAPSNVSDDQRDVQFEMPSIVIDHVPVPDAAVPDDVAAAVRRALQAIENANVPAASLPQLDLTPLTMPDLELPSLTADDADARSGEPVASPPVEAQPLAPPESMAAAAFAPPTADTRAEAIYARAAAAATAESSAASPVADAAQQSPVDALPEPGQTSVVFVDEGDDNGSSRRGALRRLIGSLRRD